MRSYQNNFFAHYRSCSRVTNWNKMINIVSWRNLSIHHHKPRLHGVFLIIVIWGWDLNLSFWETFTASKLTLSSNRQIGGPYTERDHNIKFYKFRYFSIQDMHPYILQWLVIFLNISRQIKCQRRSICVDCVTNYNFSCFNSVPVLNWAPTS